jgi:DNA-binding response OmpR family regulator
MDDTRRAPARETTGDANGTLSKERGPVLIVDDNVELAENIAEILEMAGHVTDVAASAEEALRKALTRNFDVLVTDFRLPGMNGVDLVWMMRRHRQQVVAIVISAFADEGTMLAARDAGARFLEKPLDCMILERLVRGPEGSA